MAKSTRLNQSSFTGKIRPEVKLVSMTQYPIGTIFSLWYGSRHTSSVDPADIQYLYEEGIDDIIDNYSRSKLAEIADMICRDYPEHAGASKNDYKNVIKTIVKQVIEANLPPTESVLFTFEIDKASVAWREQLVRSKFASYWTQTSRTQDLSTMDVTMNDSIELLGGSEAVKIYTNTVQSIREAYAQLSAMGVPAEDIRLQPQGHTHRVYWMITLRSLIQILNKRCLAGSTKIRLADGTQKSIKELTEEYGNDPFWIYTCSKEGRIELAKARSAGITRKNAKMIRVHLDNGSYIDCTPDHLFLMRDGSYKEAKDLNSDDSLMPLYTRLENYGKYLGGCHEEILDNELQDWKYTHWLSAEHVEKPEEPVGDFLVRHHKDCDPLNNNPENIMWIPFRKHFSKYHNPAEVLAKLRENEEYTAMMKEINSRVGKQVGTQNLINWNKSVEAKRLHGEVNRRVWNEFSEEEYDAHCEFLRDKAKKQWEGSDSKLREVHTKYKYEPIYKSCPICGKEYSDHKQISLATGETISEGKSTCGSRSCAATYRNYGRYRGYNHKVVFIEELSHTEDVYDLSVEHDNHNFAVDLGDGTGVFVHNCDWIAQASLWTPIIAGVCSILRNYNLMEIVGDFVGKPLPTVSYHSDYEAYYVADHPQTTENEDRYYGRDPLPCDGLWLAYKGLAMPEHTNLDFYDYLKSMYIQIWGDEYLKVLGWDRSDPSKLGRYDRPKSWFDSHGKSYMYAGLD